MDHLSKEDTLAANWEHYIDRWTKEGLIDPSSAERICAYEEAQEKPQGLRWPVLLAISLGGLLLGAGALLFVAAHWEMLSPAERFGVVLGMVGLFHFAGAAVAHRFSALSTVLHAVGTICLGAGIFLAGQIFHLQEHWPGGVMLWAFGAWTAWALLRDWPQAVLIALLTPMWLGGVWIEATQGSAGRDKILAEGLLLLAITYLTAVFPGKETPVRKALTWIGRLTLIPLTFAVIFSSTFTFRSSLLPLSESQMILGWSMALIPPLLLAWRFRGTDAWVNLVAAGWVVLLGTTSSLTPATGRMTWDEVGPYGMSALGAIGLIGWGLKEARKERINLGVVGFALTILFFYFSTVMDKLGRAASLAGLGTLFLLGGWLLEKTRRRLVGVLRKENHETVD